MSSAQVKPEVTMQEEFDEMDNTEPLASEDAKNQWKATTVLAALVSVRHMPS
jgi:hypothetical protein